MPTSLVSLFVVTSLIWSSPTKALYIIYKVFYNLFLHPLQLYPGPLLARSTNLVYNKHIAAGDVHIWIRQLHEKYGPFVRIAPDEITCVDAQAWKDVYGFKREMVKEERFYGKDTMNPNAPGIVRANDDQHTKIRKVLVMRLVIRRCINNNWWSRRTQTCFVASSVYCQPRVRRLTWSNGWTTRLSTSWPTWHLASLWNC